MLRRLGFDFQAQDEAKKHRVELRRIIKKLLYFKQRNMRMSNLERKAETRQKILMGGLMKKAGLDILHEINPAAILGLLLEAKNKMDNNTKLVQHYEKIGKENWS